jgi:hypothetical protein
MCDDLGEWTVFGATQKVFLASNYAGLHVSDTKGKKVWHVNFKKEQSIDQGGLFRESMSEMSVELHSCALPLFVKSANNADKIGDHRDKWVINASAC